MIHDRPDTTKTLGADIRALRRSRGLTLSELAGKAGRSVGWLSQVERDLSAPTEADLRQLCAVLEVDPSMLLNRGAGRPDEAGFVVRASARRPIGSHLPGLVEELLSPDLTDDFEMVHSTFHPGSKLETPISRPTQEVAFLVAGRLDVEIAGRGFTLAPGDSFRIRGESFAWSNPYDTPAVAIWVIAPPVY